MRYAHRHLTLIVGLGLVLLSVATDAGAQTFNGALRGDYDLTLTRFCIVSSAGFDSNFQPTGGSSFLDITLRGVINYNGQAIGGGSFTGESLATGSEIGSGAGVLQATRANQSCTVAYGVNAGGTLTQQLDCTLTFTAGAIGTDLAISGKTATLSGIDLKGQLSLDGTVVSLSDSDPNVETFNCPSCATPGPITNQRVCNGSGQATSRR